MIRWKHLQIFVIALLAAYSVLSAFNRGDFKVFLDAATVLRGGQSPYDIWFVDHNCLYLYSPFFAVLLIPFTCVPAFIPNLLWIAAGWFFTWRSIQLVKRYIPYTTEISWQKKLLVIIPFVCMLRFWIYNIELLQMTLFMLWCMLECVHLCEQKKFWWAGFILALGINIKILPIVLVPYLLLRGHKHALLPVAVFSVVFLLFPALFFGIDFNVTLHEMWWAEINPAQGNQYAIEADLGPHSLNALIPSLLMPTAGDLPIARNILSLSSDAVLNIVRIVQLFFIAFTLYFTGIRFRKAASGVHAAWELSYLLMIVPLIFPHQQKYAFFLCLPAIMYITWYVIRVYNTQFTTFSRSKWRWIIALLIASFALMTLTTDGLIGIEANRITQHFKLITYGCLALIVALALCHPKKIVDISAPQAKADQ
jgi:hypothetical protein